MVFQKYITFFRVGIKAQGDEGKEEYCWAITHAAGRPCCGRSGSIV